MMHEGRRPTVLMLVLLLGVGSAACPQTSDSPEREDGWSVNPGDEDPDSPDDEDPDEVDGTCEEGERSQDLFCCSGDQGRLAKCEEGEWTCPSYLNGPYTSRDQCGHYPAPDTGPVIVDTGVSCWTGEDCPAGEACVHRECQPATDTGPGANDCHRNRNCPRGYTCVAEGCVVERNDAGEKRDVEPIGDVGCRRDRNCPHGEICRHGRCQEPDWHLDGGYPGQ